MPLVLCRTRAILLLASELRPRALRSAAPPLPPDPPGTAQVARFLKGFLALFQLLLLLRPIRDLAASLRLAIPPMLWAGAIVLIMSSLYAVIAVYFFGAAAPDLFGTFSAALFTMFQIMTGDNWASSIVRPLLDTPQTGPYAPAVALFFVSFFLCVPMVPSLPPSQIPGPPPP